MSLQSKLFRGDAALEACLVDDRAHVVEGTRGPHVPKIQRALAVQDGALIAVEEVTAARYGRTTVNAVLDYKRDRRIINYSYQTQADNIVGKMTIAFLDRAMTEIENAPPLRGCQDERRPSCARPVSAQRPQGLREGDIPETKPATLSVAFLVAQGAEKVSMLHQVQLVARAKELLAPHGLTLAIHSHRFFPFAFPISPKSQGDVEGLRKAAEKVLPGLDNTLRVLFSLFEAGFQKSTAFSAGQRTGIYDFRNFVVINPETVHPDHGTLVHEMIHASDDSLMNEVHDRDITSVYSWGESRTVLKPLHATFLKKSFFATGG